jgi:pimeloyl-ACP methyl ester carboxylesterase
MARDALRFIDALGLARVDLLGFSLGGFVAQEIALVRPRLVRRLVLAGSARSADPDEQIDLAARDAQLEAITRWGIPDPSKLARLAGITQPTLVANGDDDKMMLTDNSRLLAQHLPNARLSIYPDSGHGFLDQYPEQVAQDLRAFLDGD